MSRKSSNTNAPLFLNSLDKDDYSLKVAGSESVKDSISTVVEFAPINPLPMQYLGSKGRISRWILATVSKELPNSKTFVDLFSGTGIVSLEAFSQGYNVILNDIQPYSYAVLSSLFNRPKAGLAELATRLNGYVSNKSNLLKKHRQTLKNELALEDDFLSSIKAQTFDWRKYKRFSETTERFNGDGGTRRRLKNNYDLFSTYYPNTYFGIRQCLEIDTIREFADSQDENSRAHILAAVISAMTFNVTSTTHLAQFLKPNSNKQAESVLRKRSKSILDSVVHRLNKLAERSELKGSAVYNLDYLEALEKLPSGRETVVYADPPYFKEHYSRYYHVLDTFYLYDYPELSLNPQTKKTTEGKYRANRIISNFGLKSKVAEAFKDMLIACKRKNVSVVISYANTSLIDIKKMKGIITTNGYTILSLQQKGLMHSAQGQPNNKIAQEYLYTLIPKDE